MLAHGATNDRKLGLLNEEKVIPSRRVVNWYNGSLDNDLNLNSEFNLKKARDMVIIGNGNIFCDIARVMLKDPEVMKTESDIP